MSCGCKTSGDASSCSTKDHRGCSSVDTCGSSYKLNTFDWLAGTENPAYKESTLVEVRFKNDRKCFYKNDSHLPLHLGSIVAVDAAPGYDIGIVSLKGALARIQKEKKRTGDEEILRILRIADEKDVQIWKEARSLEDTVKTRARIIAGNLGLQMKITDVEFQGDGNKITFYYTADARVDFRQLIKDYAAAFRTKIDMKQIGFRQEAAKIGGVGSCGRELCCSSWLTDFRSVNTNAARYQQLSINPQKLAGQCGKLKCCLNYELDSYMDALADFPPTSTQLETEKGRAFCIKIDVFKKKMWFAYSDAPMAWFDLKIEDVKEMMSLNRDGKKCPPLEELRSPEQAAKPVDLIQENNVDRFDHKGGRNRKRNPKKSAEGSRQPKSQEHNGRQRNRGTQPAPESSASGTASQAGEQGAKRNKFKKKTPPRRPNDS